MKTTTSITVRGTEICTTDAPQRYREKLARITLDSMVQFVGLLDANGTVLEINKVALDAVGIKLAEVEGKPFWTTFWWQVSDAIRQTLIDSIARAAKGEFVRWDTEIFGRAGGTETIIIDASLCPVMDDQGRVVYIAAEGRDITEKKAYEREIASKNADLQALLERIRELDEIKTQFFANVSHELRTPLSLIIGPAERLLQSELAANPVRRREAAQVILRNARMLLRHVNDLLDISKLEAGKLKTNLQNTDVAALVRFVSSHFDVLASERNVTLQVETPSVLVADVDSEKLQRILMNLLSNAFKFVPSDGDVRCRLEVAGNELHLSVEDSGPGVQPAMRKTIFERFRQGDGGTTRQVSGTGLGLAIAKEFVELHKGSIEVLESELGGALFQVSVPAINLASATTGNALQADRGTLDGLIEELRMSVPPAPQPSASAQAEPYAKARVLVGEDNPDMNRFIAQCLSDTYNVVCAFDGQDGLKKALAFLPDLIVSDIMMPKLSGADMIYQLRMHPKLRDTPVLLLSAKADDDLKNELLENGAQDFMTKPFAERELLVRARNLITVKQSRDVLQHAEKLKRSAIEATNRELQGQSKQLNELFHKAPSFMAVVRGIHHVFELANASYYQLVGHRDVLGKSVSEALPEVGEQGLIQLLNEVLATGEPYVGNGLLLRLQRERGGPLEDRYVDFVFQPITGEDGAITGVFIEGCDVTEHKRAEQALRNADRRKDEFLATLAHELRNPLAPIRHAAKIGKMQHATTAQINWSQEVIERQVDHMARLLDDLLEVSRITRAKLELRKERLTLNDSLIAAVETVRPLIEARGHALSVALPEQQVHVDADPVRFAQIFTNLLTNAAKYTDAGGHIHIHAAINGEHINITVKDDGIGIAPDLLPNVFEMFSQATSAIDRSEGGLGIGLALVHGLVLLHGGEIEAHSRGLGLGSEFVVTLPCAPAICVLRGGSDTCAGETDQARLRVLIVDDNHDSADMFAMLLEMTGHDVRNAYSGQDALTAAAEFQPQIAFLDIGMPGMNGYEVAHKIRESVWGQNVVLAAVTGWGQAEDKRLATEAGFDHHLAKPVNLAMLQPLLAAAGRAPSI